MLGVHDGGDDVSTERRADLVEKIGVLFMSLDILVVSDFELGTVCGKAAGEAGTHARAKVASDDGCSHEADLRLFFLKEIHQQVGVGRGSVGEEPRGVEDEKLVNPIGENLALHLSGDARTGCYGMQLYAETVGEFASFGKELL